MHIQMHEDASKHGCVRTQEGNVVEPMVHVVVDPPLVLLLVEGLLGFFLYPLLEACHTCPV